MVDINSPEKGCSWHFARHSGGREDGPNNAMHEHFKKNPYAALIRESIQNSLDVPLDESLPVRVDFKLGAMKSGSFPNLFELQKHISACLSYFIWNDDAHATFRPMLEKLSSLKRNESLYYIKVSDFNTTGMDYVKGDTQKPFYAFVKSVGVSSKSDSGTGGSFGFGKAAYFNMSPLRTVIVSTQTKDGRRFFEGVSSLCTHKLPNEEFLRDAVGFYDNNDGNPITNPEHIPPRFKRKEPGTDVAIIGIDVVDRQSIFDDMISAVLRNFWMSIEAGKLIVNVGDNQTNCEISRDTIVDLMDKYFPEISDSKVSKRRIVNYNPRPFWEAVHLADTDTKHIKISKPLETIGKCHFYLLKSKDALDKILYMRKPLMLVKGENSKSSYGYYGVFICDDRYGDKILRKTEGPAHDEWDPNNYLVRGRPSPEGR